MRAALAAFLDELEDEKSWWYNILGNNTGSLVNLLRLGPISTAALLKAAGLLNVQRNKLCIVKDEWDNFITTYELNIEFKTSYVNKMKVIFIRVGTELLLPLLTNSTMPHSSLSRPA